MESPGYRHIAVAWEKDAAIVQFRYIRRHEYGDYEAIQTELESVAGEARTLLLNMDAWEHISSRFVGILLSLAKRCSAEGRSFAVCRLQTEPLRILRLCKADTLISIYPSEEEARRALGIGGE